MQHCQLYTIRYNTLGLERSREEVIDVFVRLHEISGRTLISESHALVTRGRVPNQKLTALQALRHILEQKE